MSNIVKIIKSLDNVIIGMPAPIEIISQKQKLLDLTFNYEYLDYVTHFGIIAYDGHELTGITTNQRLDVYNATTEGRKQIPSVPNNWYVIEFANIDDIIIWQSHDGLIYQTSQYRKPIKICDSLTDYVKKYLEF